MIPGARDAAHGRLAEWISAYDEQGWHRTGSATDAASARWLAEIATGLGAVVALAPWSLTRVVHRRSSLVTGDGRVPGVMQFDGPPTAEGGVSGRLGELDRETAIGVIDLAGERAGARLLDARRRHAHRAIVAVSDDWSGGLALSNAPAAQDPFGPPVVQVARRHRARVVRAAEAGQTGRVEIDAVRRPATALNVEARRPATASGAERTIVLTPRSGWWHCAAERGGGLVSPAG